MNVLQNTWIQSRNNFNHHIYTENYTLVPPQKNVSSTGGEPPKHAQTPALPCHYVAIFVQRLQMQYFCCSKYKNKTYLIQMSIPVCVCVCIKHSSLVCVCVCSFRAEATCKVHATTSPIQPNSEITGDLKSSNSHMETQTR